MRHWHIILIVILVGAALLRLVPAFQCQMPPHHSDMATYTRLASEPGISVSPPPGYPLFLRAIFRIFGAENYTAVFIIQALLSTFSVFLIYYLGTLVGARLTGLIAAGIAALYPNFIVYNLTTLTESLGILFTLLMLISLARPMEERRRSILSAVLLFAGCAVRPAFLYFWPGLLLTLKKRGLFILTTLVFLSPWLIYSFASGRIPNRGSLAFYKTYNPVADGITHYKMDQTELGSRDLSNFEYVRAAFDFIVHNKWKTLDIIYNKASIVLARGWDSFVMRDLVGDRRFFNNLLNYAYLPVMFFGFLALARLYDRQNRVIALPLLSYLLFFITLAIFKIRYRLLIEPMLIIFTSILAVHACGKRLYPESGADA
ncbi:MAG: glycosyltransferase family 39 protein [Candidatus Krumholzibacteriota bacterium]|nr:glycosyltransferase family 39 protein [Candidatus Krumholzibacteriota bacterium]